MSENSKRDTNKTDNDDDSIVEDNSSINTKELSKGHGVSAVTDSSSDKSRSASGRQKSQQQQHEDVIDENKEESSGNRHSSSTSVDFVIRDNFPAFKQPHSNVSSMSTGGTKEQDYLLTGKDPMPQFPFWGYSNAIMLFDLETLRDDCKIVCTARDLGEGKAYSSGSTFFLPSQLQPRCALEAIVQDIFKRHTQHLEPGMMIPEQSGAEWWTLVLNSSDDVTEKDDDEEIEDEIGWHFDADYGIQDHAPNLFLHPRVATITYLTDVGAPTLILDCPSPPPNDKDMSSLHNREVKRGWLCHPRTCQHVAFDGRFLHGAPAAFFPAQKIDYGYPAGDDNKNGGSGSGTSSPLSKKARSETAIDAKSGDSTLQQQKHKNLDRHHDDEGRPSIPRDRITLMVNIWINHCPLDPEPLEDDVIASLTTPWDPNSNPDDCSTETPFTWNNYVDFMSPCSFINHTISTNISNKDKEDSSTHRIEHEPAGSEEFIVGRYRVQLNWNATMDDLHRASLDPPTTFTEDGRKRRDSVNSILELTFGEGVLQLKVLGEVADEEGSNSDGSNNESGSNNNNDSENNTARES